MRIIPFEVLEQQAREEYQQRLKSVPAPKVINARAAVTFDAPRSLVWGGVGYWAPPLSYEDGLALWVAERALADATGTPLERRTTLRAFWLARASLRRRKPPLWRPLRRILQWSAYTLHPRSITTDEVANVLRWLLHVEDESLVVPSDRRVTIDVVANRYAFEAEYKREPRSWADYVYGMRHIARMAAQDDLRNAVATRVGTNADKQGWQEYERDLRAAAGWHG